jgi:hypothetical protein
MTAAFLIDMIESRHLISAAMKNQVFARLEVRAREEPKHVKLSPFLDRLDKIRYCSHYVFPSRDVLRDCW